MSQNINTIAMQSTTSANDYSYLWEPLAKHPYCFIVEAVFIAISTWYIIHRKSRLEQPPELTEQEIDDLVDDWNPEPLVPPVDPYHFSQRAPEVSSIYGHKIKVNGKECLNLGTHNYLGLVQNEDCLKAAIEACQQYGVGSCGPRGFFGTAAVHLQLEQEIAKFMGAEEAILYSYGYSAISSAIPAYAKVNDVIFVDEAVSFAIQQGLVASRSKIKFFAHNDVAQLASLLDEQAEIDRKKKKQTTNRFIVVEGLYINRGDICPLPDIIALKHKHKCRLILDDTCGFGVLGATGRGTIEHFNVDISLDIDLVVASLEYACAAYGGFCAGSHFIVDHQRLSGLGYCFSASLPPLQAAAALCSIQLIQRDPQLVAKLRSNATRMHQLLSAHSSIVRVDCDQRSPIQHLRFATSIDDALANRPEAIPKETDDTAFYAKKRTNYEYDNFRLEKVVDIAHQNGYALTVARYLTDREKFPPEPSIRLTVNSMLTEQEMTQAVKVIVDAFAEVHQKFCDALV